MAVYATEEQLYETLQLLFARMAAQHADADAALLKSRLRIRLRCTEPTAVITFNARERPLQILYGREAGQTAVDLDVAILTDALHEILLGNLRLSKALGSGQLKPEGPVWKVTALADLFRAAQAIYPAVVAERGLV
ncbi:MAG: SCP2 sterol-binding domain-containing protein [Ardenticatenaceae bacterium]|nr:SCP2 sterol-binding domain-containing protein [Anaerolineales bacterium]MCB8984008.1 SCP2 sterol-binding domain-containing protein [Ardenticatenaceae bacterium]MCB8987229.1 SCP2 sterol-binding domain-containing protein [Ardenticatenaceae bacterium]